MEEAVQVLVELNEVVWARFQGDIAGVGAEEANWRPVPKANTISLIVRHLRIDVEWHVAHIGPGQVSSEEQTVSPESVSIDFEANLRELDALWGNLLGGLRRSSLAGLEERTATAYRDSRQGATPAHLLGYHLALHTAGHGAQVRTLRNLYRIARGEPARFFPDNPTFPIS